MNLTLNKTMKTYIEVNLLDIQNKLKFYESAYKNFDRIFKSIYCVDMSIGIPICETCFTLDNVGLCYDCDTFICNKCGTVKICRRCMEGYCLKCTSFIMYNNLETCNECYEWILFENDEL